MFNKFFISCNEIFVLFADNYYFYLAIMACFTLLLSICLFYILHTKIPKFLIFSLCQFIIIFSFIFFAISKTWGEKYLNYCKYNNKDNICTSIQKEKNDGIFLKETIKYYDYTLLSLEQKQQMNLPMIKQELQSMAEWAEYDRERELEREKEKLQKEQELAQEKEKIKNIKVDTK